MFIGQSVVELGKVDKNPQKIRPSNPLALGEDLEEFREPAPKHFGGEFQ